MAVLSKRLKREVAGWFNPARLAEAEKTEELLQTLAEAHTVQRIDGMPHGSTGYHSDPTGSAAAKASDMTARRRAWAAVVSETYDVMDKTAPSKAEAVRMVAGGQSPLSVATDLFVSVQTIYRWTNDAYAYAAMLAAGRGLISMDDLAAKA